MYFAILISLTSIIVFIYSRRKAVDVDKVMENEEEIQPINIEKSKEIILHFNTDAIKISFYNLRIFQHFQAKNIYQRTVLVKLYIDEPFHTTFVQLLQIYDKTESWIKSKNTKEIRLKIRNKNADFEEGIAFKVYAVSEIMFDFLTNILKYFDETKYPKEDQENIMLAALVWKLGYVKELKYLCEKNLNDIEFRECLAKKILKYYDENHDVFQILRMIECNHENLQFLFDVYNESLKYQKEYPYVSKGKEEYKRLNVDNLVDKNMKQLIALNDFSVY